jgi:hypothetical protein
LKELAPDAQKNHRLSGGDDPERIILNVQLGSAPTIVHP